MTLEKKLQDTLVEGFNLYKDNFVVIIFATLIATVGSIFIITFPPLMFGVYAVAYKLLRKEETKIKDVLKGFDYVIVSWVMLILMAVAVFFGLLLLILPGIALLVLFNYAIPLAIKEKKGSTASIRASIELARKNPYYSALLWLILAIMNVIGWSIPLAFLIVYPYTVICTVIAVEKLTKE